MLSARCRLLLPLAMALATLWIPSPSSARLLEARSAIQDVASRDRVGAQSGMALGSYWRNLSLGPDVASESSKFLARFLQTDPAGFIDGPNLYWAFRNNAMNVGDPNGTCGLPCLIGIGFVLLGLTEIESDVNANIGLAILAGAFGAGARAPAGPLARRLGRALGIYRVGPLGVHLHHIPSVGGAQRGRGFFAAIASGVRQVFGRRGVGEARRCVDDIAGAEFLDDALRMAEQPFLPRGSREPFKLIDPVNPAKGILAEIDDAGVLTTLIEAGPGASIRGTELFNRAMLHFGSNVSAVRGVCAMERISLR